VAQAISSAALFSVVLLVSSLDPALASQRCMVTDPTGTPLNVRRFDGRVIGALHNGEIVKVLRTGADSKGKPWAYVEYETNGEGWVYREFISCY
jgi:Bacterial SH3 domain